MVIFWLEMAEMLRRWMWVFVRVEWEVVKKMQEGRGVRLMDHGNESLDREGDYGEEAFELLTPSVAGGFH